MAAEPQQGPAAADVNQGAAGGRPLGESPLSVGGEEESAFDKRPEAFVGAAFAGGFAIALILRRLGP